MKLGVFTATASKYTKSVIFGLLKLSSHTTYMIEKSPMKTNLLFHCVYIGNENKMDAIFGNLIDEIRSKGKKTDRTIIFCQTRNQCALIWKTLEVRLRKYFYAHEAMEPM